jgi:hypothetical protein
MKKGAVLSVVCSVLFVALSAQIQAQSNQIVDEVLQAEAISYGNAAYLVLVAAQMAPEEISPEEALRQPVVSSWRMEEKTSGDPVTLGEYSFMLLKTFELKGGLLYRIFPGPRYASRELAYRRIILGSKDPRRHVPGEEALRLLAQVIEWKEKAR